MSNIPLTYSQQGHIKTSSDLLQEYNAQKYGNDLKPPIIEIKHQKSIGNSNHNLSNYELVNNSNQNSQAYPQPNMPDSVLKTQYYQKNQVPTYDRNNFQTYYPEQRIQDQQQQQFNPNLNGIDNNQNGEFRGGNSRAENVNYISNRLEEHQRVSEKKNGNKLYDSFTGNERDFGSPPKRQEQSQKLNQFSQQNQFDQGMKQTSKQIGLNMLMQNQNRYFNSGPEQLSNIVTSNRNRGVYKGQMKQIGNENILEGIGQFDLYNGDTYMGQFWRNYIHGDGYLLKANGDFYDGKFQNDKIQGFGRYYYSNGDLYEGNFFNGLRQSEKARFYSASEDAWFEIPFDQDRMHGQGLRKSNQGVIANVEYFQGIRQTEELNQNYNQSKLHNLGEYFISKINEDDLDKRKRAHNNNNSSIKPLPLPEVKNIHEEAQIKLQNFINENLPIYSYDKPPLQPIQDLAIYKFKDGSFYVGSWVNGVQSGFGNYYDSKAGYYEGDFLNGVKHGFGKMQYENGDSYDGGWLYDKKHDDQAIYYNFSKQTKHKVHFDNGILLQIIERVE